MMKIIKVICETNARPSVKRRISFWAWAKNHVMCWRCPKWLIAVVLVDVDLPYWTSKVEHIVAFTAIFSNVLLRMRRSGYLWTSGVNLDTAVRFADPDFLSECNISAIWRRIRWFLHFVCLMSAIFPFLVCLTYLPHALTTTSIIPTKFEVDMTIHCRVIALVR